MDECLNANWLTSLSDRTAKKSTCGSTIAANDGILRLELVVAAPRKPEILTEALTVNDCMPIGVRRRTKGGGRSRETRKRNWLVVWVALVISSSCVAVAQMPADGYVTPHGFKSTYFRFSYDFPPTFVPNSAELERQLRRGHPLPNAI